MSETVKHTPGPWVAKTARTLIHIGADAQVCEISISANHVHEDYPGRKADYVARQKANAAFIVRACNSHYELMEALKDLTDYYSADANSDFGNEACRMRKAIAALAKAGE